MAGRTELVKRIEEMALQVEDLLDEPYIDLSPERNAELDSFGEWALAALGGMTRIAEDQVPPHYPEWPSSRKPAENRTPMPKGLTAYDLNRSIRDTGRAMLSLNLLAAQCAVHMAHEADDTGIEHGQKILVAAALVEYAFDVLRRVRWNDSLG